MILEMSIITMITPLSVIEFVSQPWTWWFSGIAIAFIAIAMTLFGRSFGVSTVFKNMCNLAGAGKKVAFFDFDRKNEIWRMVFIVGAIVGGAISAYWLASPEAVDISSSTIDHLRDDYGMAYPEGNGYLPTSLFNLRNVKGVILALLGGFLVGFGARYGDGCTSGHAITGLAHFQLPSLITVIGFFIGGLLMTWLILPFLLG